MCVCCYCARPLLNVDKVCTIISMLVPSSFLILCKQTSFGDEGVCARHGISHECASLHSCAFVQKPFFSTPHATCMSCRQIVDSLIQNTVNKQHKFRCKECQRMPKNIQNQCEGIRLFVWVFWRVPGAHWEREGYRAQQILWGWTHQYLELSEFRGNRKFKNLLLVAMAPYNLLLLPLISLLVRDGRVRSSHTHILSGGNRHRRRRRHRCLAIIPISVRTYSKNVPTKYQTQNAAKTKATGERVLRCW